MRFEYEVKEGQDFESLDAETCVQADPSVDQRIRLVGAGKDLTLSANKAGWLFIAQICVEMAYLADADPLFHSHRSKTFHLSSGDDDALMLAGLAESQN